MISHVETNELSDNGNDDFFQLEYERKFSFKGFLSPDTTKGIFLSILRYFEDLNPNFVFPS